MKLPRLRFAWWYTIHNVLAHGLLPLTLFGWRWPDRFHDWTARRM